MLQIVKKESQEAVITIYVKEKTNICMIYYINKLMKTLSLTVSSFTSNSLTHCFLLLSAFFILSHLKKFKHNAK